MGAGRTTRVGVVADTHVGEYLDRLPETVLERLDGCALILHAGDLSVPGVLDELAAVAPVAAVRGDHDRLGGLVLPESLVVHVGGHRIGLTHGRRSLARDAAVITAHVLAGRRLGYRSGLHPALLRRTGPVDLLAYGHWHEPALEMVGAALCFSPGAVCPWGSLQGGVAPPPGLRGLGDRGVRRYRHQLGAGAMWPTIGILEVGSSGIRPRLVRLPAIGG